ncbi:MAG: hypothetical protein IKM26_04090, partial [Clostridia bacterium]|nr:hypothetical protein [Clostridia bacterium]
MYKQQADGAAIARVKRAEKERVNHRGELARSRDFTLLFRIACRNIYANRIGFRGSSGNGIHRCPLADKGGCSSNEAQSAEGFSLLRDNAELREIFRR